MKNMYLRRNGKRMALLWLMDNRIRETFPHAFAVTGCTVLEKLYRESKGTRPTAICRVRLAHEPRDHTGSGFPELGRRRRNLSRVGNRSSTILDSRGEERTSNDNRLRFLFQIPNEQGSPTDRLFQEYARVYIGVGTPLPAIH